MGIDINFRSKAGYTPLMCAAEKGHTLVCKSLLQKGADWYAQLNDIDTALTLAIHNGHKDTMEALVEVSNDPIKLYLHETKGRTNAVFHAAISNQTGILEAMKYEYVFALIMACSLKLNM